MSASVDGVTKIWNVRKQICVNTFEMHSDKIWALDLHESITKVNQTNVSTEDDELYQSNITIITGGGDSTFKVWKDFTIEQELIDKEENL